MAYSAFPLSRNQVHWIFTLFCEQVWEDCTLQEYVLGCLKVAGLELVEIELVEYIVGWIFYQGKWVIINESKEHIHISIEVDEPE